jgi:hypothetical protein
LFLDERSLLAGRSGSRKELLDSLICPDSAILLSTCRGIGFGKEGITGKFGELETELKFGKNQVSHARFSFGQNLTMALDSFPKPVSGSVTHESIRTRPSLLSWFSSAHKMITPQLARLVRIPFDLRRLII